MEYLLIILGFALLTAGASILVDGATALAHRLQLSTLLIGLTVVAFGTSTPELIVNIVAACQNNSKIAITNVLGSNIINVFIILGLSAVICPLKAQASMIRFDIPLSLLAALVVFLLGADILSFSSTSVENTGISGWDAGILLLFFGYFIYHSIKHTKDTTKEESEPESQKEAVKIMGLTKSIVWIAGGLTALVFGGEMIVRNAVRLAAAWGVSDAVVGVTIVALGTSLPELATSAIAACKGNSDLAIGNVIGSNIFNIFFILGISGLINSLNAYAHLRIDALMAMLASGLVWAFLLFNKTRTIKRWQGALLLIVYAIYLCWLLTSIG